MKEELFRGREITYSEEGRTILNCVNINLEKGENVGIFGTYKSGKSALLDIISGRAVCDFGYLFLRGVSTEGKSNLRTATISGVPTVLPSLSLWENMITLRRQQHSMCFIRPSVVRRSTQILLEQFGIELSVDCRLELMTRAEQFIVELLKAYLQRPEVILVDDLSLNCSTEDRKRILSLMRKFNKKGISFIITASRIEMIRPYVDRISVLSGGMLMNEMEFLTDAEQLAMRSMTMEIPPGNFDGGNRKIGDTIWSIRKLNLGGKASFSLDFNRGEVSLVLGVSDKAILLLNNYFEEMVRKRRLRYYNARRRLWHGKTALKLALVEASDLDDIQTEMSPVENLCIGMPERFSRYGMVSREKMRFIWKEFLGWYGDANSFNRSHCRGLARKERMALTLFRLKLASPDLVVFINPFEKLDASIDYIFERTVQELSARGTAVCIFTSGAENVVKYAQRYILMIE